MNEDQSLDAAEAAPQATPNNKLDSRTLLMMAIVIAGLVALIAFNMK